MAYLVYHTAGGERWDTLAYRYYGDALGYERIVAANPTVPIGTTLPAGIEVVIPLIEPTETLSEDLPPWLR